MTIFDDDTAVERVRAHLYSARVDPKWWVIRGPNGGYIAAILQRAMTDTVGDAARPARSLTVHFLTPPEAGAVEIETRIEREGRALTSTSARLVQGERLIATAVGAFSAGRESVDEKVRHRSGLDAVHRLQQLLELREPADIQVLG